MQQLLLFCGALALVFSKNTNAFVLDIQDTDNAAENTIPVAYDMFYEYISYPLAYNEEISCMHQYMAADLSDLQDFGDGMRECLHITASELQQLLATSLAKRAAKRFQFHLSICKQGHSELSNRVDCYADAIMQYFKNVHFMGAAIYWQTKTCIRLQLWQLEFSRKKSYDTLTECISQEKQQTSNGTDQQQTSASCSQQQQSGSGSQSQSSSVPCQQTATEGCDQQQSSDGSSQQQSTGGCSQQQQSGSGSQSQSSSGSCTQQQQTGSGSQSQSSSVPCQQTATEGCDQQQSSDGSSQQESGSGSQYQSEF